MNQESLVELVTYAQSGDDGALEQLLLMAYTPVSYLCQKLLKDGRTAREQTGEILQIIAHKLHTLKAPAQFEKWVIRIASARCVQTQQNNPWMEEEEAPAAELAIAGESLDEMQTVDAVQKMVDMLPEKPRTCMILLCCCELHSADIAKLTGYSVEEVKENMGIAQNFVLEQLAKYQEQGTEFYPITSLTDVLQSGMRHEHEKEAMAAVYGLLGKEIPVPPDPDRSKKILLRAALVVLAILIVLLGVLNVIVRKKNTISPDDYSAVVVPIPTEATEPEETTAPTVAETVPETTEPEETSPETKPQEQKEETKATEEKKTETTQSPAQTPASTKPSTLGPGKEVPSDAPDTGEDGHTHRYLTTKTNFNCETGGTRRYECADCDYYYTEELAATGSHTLTTIPNAASAGNATCTAPGKAYQICTKCNFAANVDDPSKPALGHIYESTTVAPTETEQGYTLHKCSRCGDSYKDNFVDALAPAESQETEASAADTEDTGETE